MIRIDAGKLNKLVEVVNLSAGGFDGEVTEVAVFSGRGDLFTRSGSEILKSGKTITETNVSILMWADKRLKNSHHVKVEDVTYRVAHIQRDDRAMIITGVMVE